MMATIAWLSDVSGILQLGAAAIAGLASLLVWRTRWRRHRYTKVFFPRDVDEFVQHYARCIRRARRRVCITSDGFNMRNPASAERARTMAAAMRAFMDRGGVVYRYQILSSMHLNWLKEIARLQRDYPANFLTFCNRRFESIGNFCVIDPGEQRTVYEYMLPRPGYMGQATEPSDFGFIYGHQAKSDKAFAMFEEVRNAPDSQMITADNVDSFARELWAVRIDQVHAFDPEILNAQRASTRAFDERLLA